MRFTLTVNMDNSAFDDGTELARVLRDVAHKLNYGNSGEYNENSGTIRDVNGNTVGSFGIVGERQ